jgi:hypothetical protein
MTIEIRDIYDNRSLRPHDAALEFWLEVSGPELADARNVRATACSVRDENGVDLVDAVFDNKRFYDWAEVAQTKTRHISLPEFKVCNPARSVGLIREAVGIIEIYRPNRNANAVLVWENFSAAETMPDALVLRQVGIEWKIMSGENSALQFRGAVNLIVEVLIEDAGNEPLSWQSVESTASERLYYFAPVKGARLTVFLATQQAVETQPFRFVEIKLP